MIIKDKITSPSNPMIKEICLLQQKGERYQKQQFLIEGEKLFFEAVRSKVLLSKVLCEEKYAYIAQNELYEYPDVQVYIVTPELLIKISDQKQPQGIIAIGVMPNEQNYQNNSDTSLSLVLESISDPGNMGTIIRTGEAFGVKNVYISNDSVDVYSPKVIRATMGSIFRLQITHFSDINSTINELQSQNIKVFTTALSQNAKDITEVLFTHPCAVVIGNESRGASNTAIECSDESIIIPMSGENESLNAAVAAGIVLWNARVKPL